MALGKNLTKKAVVKNTPDKEEDTALIDPTIENHEVEDAAEYPEEPQQQQDLLQFCVFKSGSEEYAISINLVKEVVPFPKIAPVPQMPVYILGMTNVRGNIYGVLDLGLFFNTETEQSITNKYLLVLGHEEYRIGIAIPDVPNTLIVSEGNIEQLSASRLKSAIGQKYLKGIIKKDRRMIILFDILGMISSDQFTETS